MRTVKLKRTIRKTILTSFILSVALAGYSYAAGPVSESNTISLLESVRQNYYANERLQSLRNTNLIRVKKEAPAKMWLKKVTSGEVNMVTNRYTGEQQNAIRVNDKTYFATGDGYALNMKNNSSVRFAKDPVTGKTIDKADAATYSDASGRILYFESEMSFERFLGLADSETLYGYSK